MGVEPLDWRRSLDPVLIENMAKRLMGKDRDLLATERRYSRRMVEWYCEAIWNDAPVNRDRMARLDWWATLYFLSDEFISHGGGNG